MSGQTLLYHAGTWSCVFFLLPQMLKRGMGTEGFCLDMPVLVLDLLWVCLALPPQSLTFYLCAQADKSERVDQIPISSTDSLG